MIPRFALARPTSLDEAFAARLEAGEEGAYLAGGTELLQVMKMGLAQFATLVDLKGIRELGGIGIEEDGSLRIGATTTHREIERSPVVRESFPALAGLARRVANVRVRSTGTLGGNLAFAEPHSDPATLLLACGARVVLRGPAGERALPVDAFVVGPLATARQPDEIVTAVVVPPAGPGEGRAYEKVAFFERPAASVAVRLTVRDGHVADAVVAVGSLTDRPLVVEPAGRALAGRAAEPAVLDEAAARAAEAFEALDVVGDLNGAPDYKRHLAGVLLRRAARAALVEGLANG